MQTIKPATPANTAISRIGRFYVKSELGRGTTGIVYLAHDPVIDRSVAVKTFNPGLTPAERKLLADKIINEARAAGRLSHPGIVTIYDAVNEGDTAWIAMEHLQGQTLAQMLDGGHKFRPNTVASIIRRAADALDHAHKQGVVHRDVKPGNIFLNQRNKPILVDFGIARSPNRLPARLTTLENSHTLFDGRLFGTPNYMSPEQAAGEITDLRTDVYSLGIVMYELLTGSKPFQAKECDKLMEMIIAGTPVAPHLLNPAVPRRLSDITMKAISKRPSARYQHASELALDLRRYLLSQKRKRTLTQTSVDLLGQGKAFSEHHPRLIQLSALALSIAAFIAGFRLLR